MSNFGKGYQEQFCNYVFTCLSLRVNYFEIVSVTLVINRVFHLNEKSISFLVRNIVIVIKIPLSLLRHTPTIINTVAHRTYYTHRFKSFLIMITFCRILLKTVHKSEKKQHCLQIRPGGELTMICNYVNVCNK